MSTLYQTVEDRGNPDEIEANGPFRGDKRSRWLGQGYYFWDTNEEIAHFWGRKSYRQKGYVIARSVIDLNAIALLDLLLPDVQAMFKEWAKEYSDTFPGREVTVERVIAHITNVMGGKFPYDAIRATFNDCVGAPECQYRIYPNGHAYLDLMQPVQVCIRDKRLIGPGNYKIIYPPKYRSS